MKLTQIGNLFQKHNLVKSAVYITVSQTDKQKQKQKLKTEYATFNVDSAVLIYGFYEYLENKNFKLLNFIVHCAMFVIYKCIIISN